MMRVMLLLVLLLVLLLGAAVPVSAQDAAPAIRPAEAPPDDFGSRQYVDGNGCVFVRTDGQWQPRLDGVGAVVCGYPPTPRSWAEARPLPAGEGPDLALVMPGMAQAEARLLAAVAGEMRPGEFVSDRPTNAPAAPVTGPEGLGQHLARAVAVQPAIAQAATGGLHPARRLCALLGHDGAPPAARLGADPSGGYCGGGLLALPGYAYQVGGGGGQRVSGVDAAQPVMTGAGRTHPAAKNLPGPADQALEGSEKRVTRAVAATVRPLSGLPKPSGGARLAKAAGASTTLAPMIPSGARWLEIGRHADAASADAAQRRLVQAGFPTARGAAKGGRLAVLAGPYESRQSIVRAYDRLRRAGFGPLVPR